MASSSGQAQFNRTMYGNTGNTGGGWGSNNAGVGMGGAGQIAKRMNFRKKGRNKSRAKRR